MLLSSEERLSRARIVLERRGIAPSDLLSPAIAESWTRCLAAGLDPMNAPPQVTVDDRDLRDTRERVGVLRQLALAEMELLYHQIAGTNYMIAFAAPNGVLLDTIADTSFSATARAASIRPGTLWTETCCGTNALGTVSHTREAVTVHGGEHFFHRHSALTCTAAPVFDPAGELAGVLDASSDCRSRQQHTRALVGMAATQIENGLLRQRHHRDLLIAFHSRPEYLHTLSAALLAVDQQGVILAANAQARFLLQGLPAKPGRYFGEVFCTRFEALIDALRGGRQRIEDHVGSVFAAQVENMPPRRSIAVAALPRDADDLGFVAEDAAVAALVGQVEAAARRRLPILIRGATGTGKEQLARHAHRAGSRKGAFVPVNCAALPETLIEAELFGHVDGAFTGARRGGAPGLVAEADGGTLFLDEIGEMKRSLQSVLLRFLDDYTVRPVGGRRSQSVDVLLVAATNTDLGEAVRSGSFRADLFYRLEMVHVVLPPLAERNDFATIVAHVLRTIEPEFRVTSGAVDLLRRREWQGNIRELRSVLTRLTLASTTGVIDPAAVIERAEPPAPTEHGPDDLRGLQRERIRAAHREASHNVAATARRLHISRNTVYRALRAVPDAGDR